MPATDCRRVIGASAHAARAMTKFLPLPALLAVVLVSLTGCMGQLGAATPPPASAGTHPVGVTKLEISDVTRERKLDVEVWYPAAEKSASDPVVYEVDAMGATVARLRSPTGAHRDVAPWRDGGPRPVVLLSHGASSNRFANMSLSEVLASHGYIVAAPDHDGHTTADGVFGISEEERAQSALDRPLDLSRVLDELERQSAAQRGRFAGLVDEDRIAVAGHSFGGRTALGLIGAELDLARLKRECAADIDDNRNCAAVSVFPPAGGQPRYRYLDPRVKAALLIAPAGFEFYRADGVAKIDVPVLVVGAGKDQITPFADRHAPLVRSLTSKRYLLDLKTAGHLTPTDVCDIVESIGFLGKTFGGDDSRDGCGAQFLSPRRALDLVSEASLAFFDLHLNHLEGATARLDAALQAPEGRKVASRTPVAAIPERL